MWGECGEEREEEREDECGDQCGDSFTVVIIFYLARLRPFWPYKALCGPMARLLDR